MPLFLFGCVGTYNELVNAGKGFTEMIATMKDTGSSNLTDFSKAEEEEEVKEGDEGGVSSGAGESRPTRSRTISQDKKATAVVAPTTPGPAAGQLITTEEREVGNVDFKVYMKWATAAGGLYVGE